PSAIAGQQIGEVIVHGEVSLNENGRAWEGKKSKYLKKVLSRVGMVGLASGWEGWDFPLPVD
ncbi:MAG: hypothetical protein KDM63_10885, partial [Verrucomicrobiae bacterium]|nr:hypothetical protein [Verrucomicrobiae bacterium]